MSKVIMVQGTMSGVGKSFLVAGLLRIFKQDGYRVAPFKSQNMALNSFITKDGFEMGRAQVMQAEAAGIEPDVMMNPILLKPNSVMGSQVIVNGEILGNMDAKEYFGFKTKLIPEIKKAFGKLSAQTDIIVMEGAGSPAEINLKENDIVNMGMAKMVNSNVLLAGDIDRGGVFAQLLGTLMLLEDEERNRVGGLIINKFRGDKTILDPGIEMLYQKGKIPITGVIPYMDVSLEDEDSLSDRFHRKEKKEIDIAVIRFPHISNFTDFNNLETVDFVSVRYIRQRSELGNPDLVILPGSKNTISDLKWLKENGLDEDILCLRDNVPIIGICGGFQMLGHSVSDPDCTEEGGSIAGLNLLDVGTVLRNEKTRIQKTGKINSIQGIFAGLAGLSYEGYEIHMGDSGLDETTVIVQKGNVYGTYLHGFFDKKEIVKEVIRSIAEKKGIRIPEVSCMDYREYKEKEYDRMAATLRRHLDMEAVYGMLSEAEL